MARRRFTILLMLIISSLSSWAVLPVRGADYTVSTCNSIEVSTAVATANAGGGTIDFNCNGTIILTSEIIITADVIMDFTGQTVTFDALMVVRHFTVNAGASLTLTNARLIGGINSTSGGAILNNGTLTVNDSEFTSNGIMGNGGVIFNNNGTVVINNSEFTFNSASTNGGVIYNNGTLTITGSLFSGNTADFGGAIFHLGGLDLNVTGSRFTNNTADFGGAIYNNLGFAFVNSSTFDNNIGLTAGGGIHTDGTMTVGNSTFFANSSPNGAAFQQDQTIGVGSTSMTYVTMVDNTGTTGTAIHVNNGVINANYSLISGAGALCSVTAGTLTLAGDNLSNMACASATISATLNLDAFNGTVVPLLGSSSAINFFVGCSPSVDQVGTSRPQGPACDVGAYEAPVATVSLNASAVCVGNDLQVTIIAGDGNFNITSTSGAGLPLNNVTATTHTITGPDTWNDVTVTELTGNTESINLGNFACVASATLSASAICVGNDLHVTISNGDPLFQITASSGTLLTGLGLGTHIITGPVNETGVNVTELAGDTENFPLGNIICVASVVTPPVTSSPAVTVLGCALDSTDGVEVAGAPDNTYCRVLMKNGGVVGFSGAIPADLIGLGVILGVDVYRLEGGATVNTFPDYARICLAGVGRFFYMDGRNAPRYAVEMPSDTVDNMTCAWIPAPGTVILTN